MATQRTSPEEDIRAQLLNSILTCPHRDTDKVEEVHKMVQEKDPVFYAHFASWHRDKGEIRDFNEVFCAHLITDPYIENREVGLGLFGDHVSYMKERITGYIKGKIVKLKNKTGKKITVKVGKKNKQVDEYTYTDKKVGLNKNIPGALKNEVAQYLRWLEKNDIRFDAEALKNAKHLKYLYASRGLQIKPSERAQKVLFEKKYPEDSRLNIFKKITSAKSAEAAKLIVENNIPYSIAVGLIEKVTPAILVALVHAMTPQELIANMASLKEKGAYDNPELKTIIMTKLDKAKTDKRVTSLKPKEAIKAGNIKDEEIERKLDSVADASIKKSGVIRVDTAVFVDRSGSMSTAIEIGKRVAALISGATEAAIYAIVFDSMAAMIEPKGTTLTAWEKAFAPIHPHGNTSVGSALDFLSRRNIKVDQIVIITDEQENCHPLFVNAYAEYTKKYNVTPHVVIINIGSYDSTLSQTMKAAGIEFDSYKPTQNDYVALPGLLTLLARKTKLDLVYEIMDYPLATRRPFPVNDMDSTFVKLNKKRKPGARKIILDVNCP